MVNFILKHKKVRGAITIFMVIAYLGFYVFTGALVDGSRIHMAQTNVEDLQQLMNDNILSQYDRGLYEHYGLFGVLDPSEEAIKSDLMKQIAYLDGGVSEEAKTNGPDEIKNLDFKSIFEPYGINVENLNIDHISLAEPEALRAQIRDNMRYKAPAMLSKDLLDTIDSIVQIISMGMALLKSFSLLMMNGDGNDVSGIEIFSKNLQDKPTDICKSYFETIETTYKINEAWYETAANAVVGVVRDIVEFVAEGINSIKMIISLLNDELDLKEVKESGDKLAKDFERTKKLMENTGNLYNEFIDYADDSVSNVSSGSEDGDEEDEEIDEDEEAREKAGVIANYINKIKEKVDNTKSLVDNEKEEIDKFQNQITLMLSLNLPEVQIEGNVELVDYVAQAMSDPKKGFIELYKNEPKNSKAKTIYKSFIEWLLIEWLKNEKDKIICKDLSEKLELMQGALNDASIRAKSVNDVYGYNNFLGFLDDYIYVFEREAKYINDNLIDKYIEKVYKKIALYTFLASLKLLISVKDDYSLDAIKKGLMDSDNSFGTINDYVNTKYVPNNSKTAWDRAIDFKNWSIGKITKWKEDMINKVSTAITLIEAFKEGGVVKVFSSIASETFNMLKHNISKADENMVDCLYIIANCRDYAHTYWGNYILESGGVSEIGNFEDDIFNEKFLVEKKDNNAESDAENEGRNLYYLLPEEFKKDQTTPAEVEYILFGNPNTYENVKEIYKKIYNTRLILNYISALVSPPALAENAKLASISFYITFIFIPLIYALPQSLLETKNIMVDSKKPYLFNGGLGLKLEDGFINIIEDILGDGKNIVSERISSSFSQGFSEAKKDKLLNLKDSFIELVKNAESNENDLDNSIVEYGNDPIIIDAYNIVTGEDVDEFISEIIDDSDEKIGEFIEEEAKKGYIYTKEKVKQAIENYKSKSKQNISKNKTDDNDTNDNTESANEESSGDSLLDKVKDFFGHYIHAKGGYTFYLRTLLTEQGAAEEDVQNNKGKNLQIARLQNVITTNMKRYNSSFDLKKTYTEFSINGKYSMKYIFMTQSLFKMANLNFDANRYNFRINTASAY